jgi:hypothetical protein
MPSSLTASLSDSKPKIVGIVGPWISQSRSPTLYPRRTSQRARFAATVLFPVPLQKIFSKDRVNKKEIKSSNMLSNSFKWKHFVGEIILLNVRWYLRYPLSYRNLKEMMIERGIQVDHSTIMRWVHQYSPEIEKKVRRYLRPTNDSWRVDETYVKVKGEWKYLYRAVDSTGNTVDFMLSEKRVPLQKIILRSSNLVLP